MSNIAFKKALDGEISETSAHGIIPWLRQSGLVVEDTDALMDHALEIAFELRHPVYDCIYVALAERHDGAFITHDRKLLARLSASRFADLTTALLDVERLIEVAH